eukprot:scaffold18509_cov23-Tisochrysis_lutea.AAC.1
MHRLIICLQHHTCNALLQAADIQELLAEGPLCMCIASSFALSIAPVMLCCELQTLRSSQLRPPCSCALSYFARPSGSQPACPVMGTKE